MQTFREILDEIQYLTKQTIGQVAKSIGYSRPYMTTAVSNESSDEVKSALLAYLAEIKQNVPRITNEASAVGEPVVSYHTKSNIEVIELTAGSL